MTHTWIEVTCFCISAAVFSWLEAQRPARSVQWWRRWHRDVWPLAWTVIAFVISKHIGTQVLHWMRVPPLDTSGWPWGVRLAVVAIGVDFAVYWSHRWMHSVPSLWKAHVMHHSLDELTWLSGFRESGIHALLFAVPQVLALTLVPLSPQEMAGAFALEAFFQLFAHANINLRPHFIWCWLNNPLAHRVHHLADGSGMKKNFGSMLLIWDKLFGTYHPPVENVFAQVTGLLGRVRVGWRQVIGV